jgi:hypothetical protein
VYLVGVALVSWAGTYWLLRNGYSMNSGGLVPMLVLGTLSVACVAGAGSRSPFAEAERTVARSLPLLRLGHLSGLTLGAALLLILALLAFDLEGVYPADPLLMLLRNLAMLAGLAFLAARLLGAGLSWTLPLVYAAAALMGSSIGDDAAWWALPLRSGTDWPYLAIAFALLAAGFGLVCHYGARDSAGEQG